MKLTKRLKAKWVKALRSGLYEQGHTQLQKGEKFCCLGVLASIVDPKRNAWRPDDGYYGEVNEDDFPARPGQLKLPLGVVSRLANFNDGYYSEVKKRPIPPRSFKWIASYIERYL